MEYGGNVGNGLASRAEIQREPKPPKAEEVQTPDLAIAVVEDWLVHLVLRKPLIKFPSQLRLDLEILKFGHWLVPFGVIA